MVHGVGFGDVPALVLDNYHQLALRVEAGCILGPNDGLLGADDRGGRLVEHHWLGGTRAVVKVAGIVQPNGQDFGRDAGGQQLDLVQGVGVVGNGVVTKGRGAEFLDVVPFNDTVAYVAVGQVASDFHGDAPCLNVGLSPPSNAAGGRRYFTRRLPRLAMGETQAECQGLVGR